MSSNSSAEPVRRLIDDSFRSLRMELPGAFAEMVATSEGLAVTLEIADEVVSVTFEDGDARIVDGPVAGADATVATDRAAIGAVLDGTVSLTEAIEGDRLRVVGPLDALIRMYDGLAAYLAGAVRAPSHRGLAERFGKSRSRGDEPGSNHG